MTALAQCFRIHLKGAEAVTAHLECHGYSLACPGGLLWREADSSDNLSSSLGDDSLPASSPRVMACVGILFVFWFFLVGGEAGVLIGKL